MLRKINGRNKTSSLIGFKLSGYKIDRKNHLVGLYLIKYKTVVIRNPRVLLDHY